jgi:hypothetical protein
LERGLGREKPLLEVLVGPRQVGKTTAAQQVAGRLGWPMVFGSADAPLPPGPEWVETHWQRARREAGRGSGPPVLLVLDEIQKVRGWQEVVKRLWDEDQRERAGRIRVLLLGSSSLQLQRGATESLAGRFFLHRCMHWSLRECRDAFGWDLERWLYFGGYPGAAAFSDQAAEWRRYVSDSLIEAVLSRDVLQIQSVAKPALLRHLFMLACAHPAQILSYNKMLGQLTDAGNTTTLAGYAQLLESAFLLTALPAYSGSAVRQRAGSPKWILWNNALVNATNTRSPAEVAADPTWRGRLVENAVGAHLLNHLPPLNHVVHSWRQGHHEVDFVIASGTRVWALEVKSGRAGKPAGLDAFRRRHPAARSLVIGGGGLPLDEFLLSPPAEVLE